MPSPISARRLIARWEAEGLIDRATASRLYEDVARRQSRFGLGAVLAVLGAILLSAAIMTLVAANWEAIPRVWRVAMIIAVLWVGYLGGAWRESRGDHGFAAALYIIAAFAFGGGIALVGQMYHISGDAADAALLWTGGVLLAALLLRSGPLAATGVAVGGAYLVAAASDNSIHSGLYIVVVPFIAAAGWALAVFTQSHVVRHFVTLLAVAFLFTLRINLGFPSIMWATAAAGVALVVAESRWPTRFERATGFGLPLAAYGFAAAFAALMIQQLDDSFDTDAASLVLGSVALALAVGALVLSGRHNAMLRWLAYAAFSLEVIYLASVTIGSLVGTAGFFLTVGLLVLAIAFAVMRLERRFHNASDVEATS